MENSKVSADPDMLVDIIKGRKNAFIIIGSRHLKITYKTEDGIINVITAMVKGE